MVDLPWVATATTAAAGWTVAAVAHLRSRRHNAHLGQKLADLTRALNEAEARRAAAQRLATLYEQETRYLVTHRLPAYMDAFARNEPGVIIPGPHHPDLNDTTLGACHQRVLDAFQDAARLIRQGISGSSRSAIKNILDDPQSLLVRLQHALTAELDRHKNAPAGYIEGLMRLDHRITRVFHAVQRLRIISGSWPGLQRGTAPIADIVEAARGRVEAYQTIRYLYDPATGKEWVEGRCVEPITVALTELMANAAAFSARPVDVSVHESAAGYAIVVDDRGSGMNVYQRDRANALMSQNVPLDVTALTDTRQFGFPIIGRLVGDYGFRVEIAGPSSFGGTRVVLLIPTHMIVPEPEEAGLVTFTPERLANPDMSRNIRPAPTASPPTPRTATGLPKRQRGAPSDPPEPRSALRNVTHLDEGTMARGLENIARTFADPQAQIREGEEPK